MDCTLIGAGATLYCPVCVPGALFQLGDVEVCQSCAPCAVEMVLRCGVPKQPGKPLVKG